MESDKAPVRDEPMMVIVPADKHVVGMTAREACRAGGVVIGVSLSDDDRQEMVRLLSEQGAKAVIVNVVPGEEIEICTNMPKLCPQPMPPRDMLTYVIHRQAEAKVTLKRDVRPPWMGKKPWWQR